MIELKGTSWQQRYSATQIHTLRCRVVDKPGMLGALCTAIGKAGANIGPIDMVEAEPEHMLGDITLYITNAQQLEGVLSAIRDLEGAEIVDVQDDILEIHRRGSIEMLSRVPIRSQTDLRMLYTPGVAAVCKVVEKDPASAWQWTGICDRIAIVTNGTAILGLGDIGPLAGLPVMEGKAAIFAEFVGISGVPILIDTKDPDEFVDTVVRISSGFGAIQLEDVAAPACFEIEQKLIDRLDIPVFHDDQHGTATIVLAALISALKKTGKKQQDCTVLMLGAGAAGIAISEMLLDFGFQDIVVYDSKGAIYPGRTDNMNPYKAKLAEITNKKNEKGTLAEGFRGKDVFIGVSRPDMVSKEMVASMSNEPIVLPLANPVGEISTEDAIAAGAAVAADGRAINNALAYPAIFRGALDARATRITMGMKIAAARRIAELAGEGELLPDILDRDVHRHIADAVAAAWGKKGA